MSIETELTLKQLRAFVAVYRLGKLSAAADELSVTQSAVSMLIRQVEQTLNTTLFDRTTRRLAPTRAAEDAIGVAERILGDVSTLGKNFRDLALGSQGRVHIAAPPAPAATVLTRIAHRFSATYKNIDFVINDCAPNQFLSLLQTERVDLGIGAPPDNSGDFLLRPILADKMRLAFARGHPFEARETIRWRDLDGQPLIAFRPSQYGVRNMIDAVLAEVGVTPKISHEVGFLGTAAWMATTGLGLAIIPDALAQIHILNGLVVRPLVEPEITRPISIVTKRGRSLSPSCQLFLDMLDEIIAQPDTVG